jgi:cobaltochelatase CobT
MKRCSLERSLHILGPVLGRKRGVEVRIGGTRACTDGNTIWLPALPIDDAEAAVLGFGLLFHETNHLRYTDFAVARGEGLVGALTNALEDIRIDGLGQQEYRGALREEEQLVSALIRRGEIKACTAGDHPARVLESYVMWRLEYELLGVSAARLVAEQAACVLGQTFAPEMQARLDALMFAVRDCHSTLEVHALAQRIAQMLEDEARAEALRRPAARGGCEAPQHAAGPAQQALDAAAEDHARGIGELARTAVNAKGREAPALNLALSRGARSRVAPGAAEGAAFALEAKAASNALRHRLAGLLQAATLCRRYPAPTGLRIDTRRLALIEAGAVRIFARHMAGLMTDTAVQLLIDRSGSMGSSRGRDRAGTARPIELARAACYATALALMQIPGIAVAAAAFPGHGENEVAVLAQFQERVDRQVSRFASLEAGGGTPLCEALLWSAAELLLQRQARRILLVATDGAYDADLGQAMTARLAAAGIETLGIGIHCDVSHLFARSRAIVAVADLPQAMFDLLLEAIPAAGASLAGGLRRMSC